MWLLQICARKQHILAPRKSRPSAHLRPRESITNNVIGIATAPHDTVKQLFYMYIHTHTHTFNGPLSRTTRVSPYQKGKTNLDFTEARDSEWQWQQLGHMQVCTSLQTDNHTSIPPLSFLQAGCPSCHPTNSVKALKVMSTFNIYRMTVV